MNDITRHDVAVRLTHHLQHRMSLEELVAWAEEAIMEASLDGREITLLRDVLGRIGLADVRAFGLSWEDLEQLLSRLGYRVEVSVTPTVAGHG